MSEAEATNDFPSLLAQVRAGAEVVIERNVEAVAVLRPAAPNVRLLSESLRLAKERGANTTLDDEFGREFPPFRTLHSDPRLAGILREMDSPAENDGELKDHP